MRNREVDKRIEALTRRVGMISAEVSSAVGELLAPLLAELNEKVVEFHQACELVSAQSRETLALHERVEAVSKRLESQDEHDEFIEGQLDEVRTELARVAASTDQVVQTLSAFGKSA